MNSRSLTNTAKSHGRPSTQRLIGFGLAVLLIGAGLLLIRRYGEPLIVRTTSQVAGSPGTSATGDAFLRVLVALTAIIALGLLLGRLFASVGQPPVIGEILAGILLGPSILGAQISALVLPPAIAPFLNVIGQFGIVLYMFLVGLELNPGLLRERANVAAAISYTSIIAPFLLGTGLAWLLYPLLSIPQVPFISFALFMGLAMSITAFPVLARIITDYGLTRTRLGAIALSSAALDDVAAWCLLAFVVGIAKAQGGAGLFVAVGAIAFIAFMLLLARPGLTWLTRRTGGDFQSRTGIPLLFTALLLAALVAEAIGIHAIFGAFLLGAIIPHDSAPARRLSSSLTPLVTILLLPAFFAFTGMQTRIDLLSGPTDWLICGLIILVAVLGKFGGSFAGASWKKLGWRNAAMIGALVNTRGLMELIVLSVGLQLRVISPTVYSMMVVMALVTTALTAPLLHFFRAKRNPEGAPDLLADDLAPFESEIDLLAAPSLATHEHDDPIGD